MPKAKGSGSGGGRRKRNPNQSKADENRKYNTKDKASQSTSKVSNTNANRPGVRSAWGVLGKVKPSGGTAKRKKDNGKPQNETGNPRKPQAKPKDKKRGNPGNRKDVGNAGEKEEKGMYPGGGVRGKGDNKDKKKKK